MIVNEICLKKFFNYTYSIYGVGEKFNNLERKNYKNTGKGVNTKTKASTGAKAIFCAIVCQERSLKELMDTTHNKTTSLRNFYEKGEYIPKTHGLRDCIINTDYEQIISINNDILNKLKQNKFFRKNLVDGLCVVAYDGVETTETKKEIDNLPEREHENGDIRKYIKYLIAMNIGERTNIIVGSKQMTETEKVTTKSGAKKAKTFGETTGFLTLHKDITKTIGKVVDVNVLDALYLNSNVMNEIADSGEYFVIRMEDKTKHIYKDANGLFENSKPILEYEIVEVIKDITVKYSKEAKHKDYQKTKTKKIIREITEKELNEKELVDTKFQERKNSTKETKTYEKVIRRIKVWDDEFDFVTYKGKVRVVRTVEEYLEGKKTKTQELYIATNMLTHPLSTIVKIMHLRWHIENNGFRKLKQNFKLNHIYIGEFNAINYIIQMIILVSNLLEVYLKVRLKDSPPTTYIMLKKLFEKEINITKDIGKYFVGDT